jgi:hypothetical protein
MQQFDSMGEAAAPVMGRGRKRPAAMGRIGAPSWLVARSAKYRQRFPLRDYYDVPFARGSQASLDYVGPSWREATPLQRQIRKATMMTGRGLYRGKGGYFGRMLGNMFGQGDLGDKIGDFAWNTGKKFLPPVASSIGDAVFGVTDTLGRGRYMRGRGQYAVNNLVTDGGATASSVVPAFNPSDMHEITYSNREYIRDVYAPPAGTVFTIQSWNVNPGLAESFPWLSQLAINFEEYELMQLAFTYKSTVADFASASGQVGQIVMATQYNPNADPFADKEEMMLYEGGMSCKTTESLIHGVECDPAKLAGARQKYVRQGGIPPTEDLKNYDLGKTSLAVLNAPSTYAGQQIGELWVSYTVRLRKPKIASGNCYNQRRDVFVTPAFTGGALPTSFAAQNALLQGSRNSLGCIVRIAAAGATPPSGAGTDDLNFAVPTQYSGTPQHEVYRITIPDSYSGILSIHLQAFFSAALAQTTFKPVSLAPSTIIRFADIPSYWSNTRWTHIQSTQETSDVVAGPSLYKLECQLHIRVLPPVGGVPNIIAFTLSQNMAFAGGTIYTSCDIQQYNTFLSVADNGRNDAIDLYNAAGQTTYWTP